MTTALTDSVNIYFAQVGERLGNETMFKYMDRFGFYQDPELGYPDSQWRRAASTTRDSSSMPATRSTSAGWRSARSAC